MPTLIIKGALIAEQPIAYSLSDISPASKGDPQPLPVFVKYDQNGVARNCLYMTGSGINGTLRRHSAEPFIRHMQQRDNTRTPLSFEALRLAWVGGVKGKGAVDPLARKYQDEWLRRNPVLSLFGAGDAGVLGFVAGRAIVENAVWDQAEGKPVVLGNSVRSNDFTRSPERLRLLDDDGLGQFEADVTGASENSKTKEHIAKLKRDIAKARKNRETDDQIAKLDAELQAELAKTESVKTNSVLLPLPGWQAIPQGARLTHRFVLRQVDDVQFGTFLNGMHEFALNGAHLGGHRKAGCGEVSGQYTVASAEGGRIQELGSFSFSPYQGITLHGEALERASQAATAFIENDEFDLSVPTARKAA